MTSHAGMMILFAACTSIVFGALLRDDPREQLMVSGRIFGALVGGAYLAGWIMVGLFG